MKSVYGIHLTSRHDVTKEWDELTRFATECKNHNVSRLVQSADYDSKGSVVDVKTLPNISQNNVNLITEIAKRNFWCFMINGENVSGAGEGYVGGVMNKYTRKIQSIENADTFNIDVYSVLVAFGVTCPARAHAIKKLLMAGDRGHKDAVQDLEEAGQAIRRAVELERDANKFRGILEGEKAQ